MKRLLSIAIFAVMLVGLGVTANAQDENKSPEENKNPDNVTIPEGKLAKLSLQTRLSSKLSEIDDEVTAVLYEPVRGRRACGHRSRDGIHRARHSGAGREATSKRGHDDRRLRHDADAVRNREGFSHHCRH